MPENHNINCWITGARGFIGRHLALHLASCGWRVAGIGHGIWAPSEASAWGLGRWLNGEVSIGNLVQMERDCGPPDVVFHLAGGSSVGAALANPLEDFRRTVVSTSELLEWMRLNAKEAQLVAVSSAAVYGSAHEGPIPEHAAVAPVSTYGVHKLMMEDLCRSYAANYGLHVVLPRLFSVYGCGLRKQLLWDLCEKMASGQPVELGGSGDELRDWIEVRDVVQGLRQISRVANAEARPINLASGQGIPVREVARMVAASWRVADAVLPQVSFSGRARLGDPFSLVADVGQMSVRCAAPEISFAAGVADYVAWFRSLDRAS